MKKQILSDQAQRTWKEIAALPESDQASSYWSWAREVVAAQNHGDITIQDAAKLLIWPDSVRLEGLSTNANILIVLDTADAIEERCAYIGVPEEITRDWADLVARVERSSLA